MKRKSTLIGIIAAAGGIGAAIAVPAVASATGPSPDAGQEVAAENGVAAASIATTLCWPRVSNGQVLTWYDAPVESSQAVVASASEGVYKGEGMNEANVYSQGVTVLNSAVQVRIHTGWGLPLNVCVHFVG